MNLDSIRRALASTLAERRSRRVLALAAGLLALAVAIPLALSHSGSSAALATLPMTATSPAATVTSPTSTASAHPSLARTTRLAESAHNPFLASDPASASGSTAKSAGSTGRSAGSTGKSPGSTGKSPGSGKAAKSAGSAKSARTTGASTPAGAVSTGTSTTAATHPPSTSHHTTAARSATHLVTVTTPTVTVTAPTAPAQRTEQTAEVSLHQSGVTSAPTVFHHLSRDQLLPSDTSDFSSYLGLRPDARTAVFMLARHVAVSGQGDCAPSAAQCTFLLLQPGQSATLVVYPPSGGALTYVLSDIKVATASSPDGPGVDGTGAAEIAAAAPYFSTLQNLSYGDTGLLTIALGPLSPVTR